MTDFDLYSTLGVPRDAPPEQIDAAYAALVSRYELLAGNDPEANARYRQIRYAYDTLRDPDRRRSYDESLLAMDRHPHLSRNPVDKLTRRLPDPLRVAVDWVVTIAGAIAIVLAIKAFVVNPYRIPSSSMEPTFHCAGPGLGCEGGSNDRIIANRFIYHFQDPQRGDVVVFNPPAGVEQACGAGGTYVKRLIGLPGETVSQQNGIVSINGQALDEPYLGAGRRGGPDFGPVQLGANEYWMMGDNRALSCDSRRWLEAGLPLVTRQDMIGPVFFLYWPLDRIGFR